MKTNKYISTFLTFSMVFTSILPFNVSFGAASVAIDDTKVSIINKAGIPDEVTVTDITSGDFIKVYKVSGEGDSKVYTYASGRRATGTSVVVSVPQLSTGAGTIAVTRTTAPNTESEKIEKTYDAESVTELDSDLKDLLIQYSTVTNRYKASDSVEIQLADLNAAQSDALVTGDRVKIYKKDNILIGNAVVPSNVQSMSFTLTPELDNKADQKILYMTISKKGYLESTEKVEIEYFDEQQTDSTASYAASAINNVNMNGMKDSVTVTGVKAGDVVQLYLLDPANPESGALIKKTTATVPTGKTTVTLLTDQLGQEAGLYWISVASPGYKESDPIEFSFIAEEKTPALGAGNTVTIVNNAGTSDTISTQGLSAGDSIKAYADGQSATPLFQGIVPTGSTSLTLQYKQLGSSSGSIHLTRTIPGKGESDRFEVAFEAEAQTAVIPVGTITISNNAGTMDSIKVTGLTAGDVIKAYLDATVTTALGTATVGTSGEATITIKQLGTTDGSVYLSLTRKGSLESNRVEKSYAAEPVTDALNSADISVSNNAGINDQIICKGVTGTIFKVYATGDSVQALGTGTVASGRTSVEILVKQLGTASGSIHVSATTAGKSESARVKVDYDAELTSESLNANRISIDNNATLVDLITISDLVEGDIITIYETSDAVKSIGKGTVSKGKSEIAISIKQLGEGAGSIHVSITNLGKSESIRTKVDYEAEPVSSGDDLTAIIANNAGAYDEISISNVDSGDIIRVYNTETGGVRMGMTTIAKGYQSGMIQIAQLGTGAGSVYISRTIPGQSESPRKEFTYLQEAETQIDPDAAPNTLAINNKGADLIVVYGLVSGDIVRIYSAENGGRLLGSATVAARQTHIVLNIAQLGAGGGSVYYTITKPKSKESSRMEITFSPEI